MENKNSKNVVLRCFCSGPHPLPQEQRDPEQQRLRMTQVRYVGFTLVELLVVVLIIGVLSAIAIPMYQGAVDKSRWSTLLAPVKAIQTAQDIARMENGSYAYNLDELSISLPGEIEDNSYKMTGARYSINTKTPSQSNIEGQLDTLENVKISMALKAPDNYLFCEAKSGDSRAERLCKNLLAGQKAGSKNGYDKYLLDYPGPCAWANTTGQCYVSEEARCTAMGMPYSNGYCGYTEWAVSSSTQINEGGVCDATGGGCRSVTVNEGGVCDAGGYAACYYAIINDGGVCNSKGTSGQGWECEHATINKGGICIGRGPGSCTHLTVNGGKCIANNSNTCWGSTYTNGGCCEDYGKGYCGDAPKCSD